LYLRNEKGHVVGRKLIALHDSGKIFGFNTYGKTTSTHENRQAWIKIMFDLFCLNESRRIKAQLGGGDDIEEVSEDDFRFSLKWYFDCLEPFDWWVHRLFEEDSLADKRDIKIVIRALQEEDSQRSLKKGDFETIRALLFIGEDALPFISPEVSQSTLAVIDQNTQSEMVRAKVRELL